MQAFASFSRASLYTILVLNHFAPKHPATLPRGLQPCPTEPLLTLLPGTQLPARVGRQAHSPGLLPADAQDSAHLVTCPAPPLGRARRKHHGQREPQPKALAGKIDAQGLSGPPDNCLWGDMSPTPSLGHHGASIGQEYQPGSLGPSDKGRAPKKLCAS